MRQFLGAACLCGVGYTVALLMADEAFTDPTVAEIAKASVLAGSTLAAILGAAIMLIGPGNSHEQVTPG